MDASGDSKNSFESSLVLLIRRLDILVVRMPILRTNSHPGHAETLAITYDPTKTSFEALLDFFFRIHDPTTRNRQGNDVGSSYRSAIFYQDDDELHAAESVIEKVNQSKLYKNPVVTSLEKFKAFYSAEEYHQDYLRKNPGGYTCHYVRTDTSLL